MADCVNCKQSILSQTPSSIPNTKCNGNCPEDVVCNDIIPGKCVFYSGQNLPCTGINFGDDISTSIAKIESKYGTKVSANDTCCGFLFDKITVEGFTKEIEVVDGCETLKLTANPTDNCSDGWITILLEGMDTNAYYKIECDNKVLLKGNLVLDDYSQVSVGVGASFPTNLPQPSIEKLLTLNSYDSLVLNPSTTNIYTTPGLFHITTSGVFNYLYNMSVNNPPSFVLCLDGLSYYL